MMGPLICKFVVPHASQGLRSVPTIRQFNTFPSYGDWLQSEVDNTGIRSAIGKAGLMSRSKRQRDGHASRERPFAVDADWTLLQSDFNQPS